MAGEWSEWTDVALIRQWWFTYLYVLDRPASRTKWHEENDQITDELMRRGVIKEGRRMTREGAEDLADQCDEKRRKMP